MKKIITILIFAGMIAVASAEKKNVSDVPNPVPLASNDEAKKQTKKLNYFTVTPNTADTTQMVLSKSKYFPYLCYIPTVAIQIGTDLGGAIPDLKFIPKTFKAYPQMRVAIGLRVVQPVTPHWTLSAEINYKTVAMNADAVVENMHAWVPDGLGGHLDQFYSGQAKMKMSFTMLEFPLYFTVKLGKRMRNKLHVGGYAAWMIDNQFVTDPTKGYIGTEKPDYVGEAIPMPDPKISMDFGNVLKNWDAGLCFGYEYQIISRLNIGFKLFAGLTDIFDKDVFPNDPKINKVLEYSMKQMRGTFVISWDLYSPDGWLWDYKKKRQQKQQQIASMF